MLQQLLLLVAIVAVYSKQAVLFQDQVLSDNELQNEAQLPVCFHHYMLNSSSLEFKHETKCITIQNRSAVGGSVSRTDEYNDKVLNDDVTTDSDKDVVLHTVYSMCVNPDRRQQLTLLLSKTPVKMNTLD